MTEDSEPVKTYVDVYDVLWSFDVRCPAVQHAIKKLLKPGQRGVKDSIQDKLEAVSSVLRSIDNERKTSEKPSN